MDTGLAFLPLMLCLALEPSRVELTPICPDVDADCRMLSVADLFDRVIQHSSRIHSLSTDLYVDLEKYFRSSRNDLDKTAHKCHTSTFQTPNGKENVQKIPREELTLLIMSLLGAWKGPLSEFHRNIGNYRDLSETGQSKAQEIGHLMWELEMGLEKVAAKMQSLGIISNSLTGRTLLSSSSAAAAGLSTEEDALLNDYQLLHCFRRDTNKVQSYLNVLKCRTVPENSC
ncbi:prolactin-2-like [Ambystoma mexicanum]|uniref:prolactin-2-like n=1 Tax=Ambystoma mexicanum TaxID=8296 RepID=UPI0037E78E76